MKYLVENTQNYDGPIYFRVAKGDDNICSNVFKSKSTLSSIQSLNSNSKIMIVSAGIMLETALKLKIIIEKNIKVGVIHLPVLHPLKTKKLLSLIKKSKTIISLKNILK